MSNKTRFKVEFALENFGQNYVKTVHERAILQGAIFMSHNEVRIWWVIPELKTEKEKWGCALLTYNK